MTRAILGALTGCAAALLCLTLAMRGNIFGIVLLGLSILPMGLVLGLIGGLSFSFLPWRKQAGICAENSWYGSKRKVAGLIAADAAMISVSVGCVMCPPDRVLIAKFYAALPYYQMLAARHFSSDSSLNEGKASCVVEEWGQGWAADDDTARGYIYTTTPPENVVGSLDHIKRPGPNGPCETYRHITGNWYLYYCWIPDDAS